jgi:hypothetical protein
LKTELTSEGEKRRESSGGLTFLAWGNWRDGIAVEGRRTEVSKRSTVAQLSASWLIVTFSKMFQKNDGNKNPVNERLIVI